MADPARQFLHQPIIDRADAEKFIYVLTLKNMMFHFEDDPDDIVVGHSGDPLFLESEFDAVRARVREMYALDWAICECPIGFSLLCDDCEGNRDLMGALVKLLKEYCEAQGLELMSADDLLFIDELKDDQRAWLRDYCDTWDRAMEMVNDPEII